MEAQERLYKDGFNNGYLLAKYEPDLLNKLLPHLQPINDYFDGIISGKEQFDIDKTRTHSKDISHKNTPDKDKEDRERDDR